MYKFWHEGRQVLKKGFATKAEASAAEAERRKLLKNPPLQKVSISLGSLVARYIAFAKARFATNTWRAKLHYYQQFIGALGSEEIAADEITALQCHDFLEQVSSREGSKNANRHLKDLNALYNWAIKTEILRSNPFRSIDPFPEEPFVKYVPPPEDIDRVLMAATDEDLDLLICVYHTGGRIGEILRLKWDDVNLEKRSVTLWTRKRRGGQLEPDQLAISDILLDVLERRWKHRNKESAFVFYKADGAPYSYQSKRNMMEDLCQRAGVTRFGFHAIRHHVASIIADSGKATLGQIQKFLRHRRQTTTEKYLHELTRDQTEIAGLLDESWGTGPGTGSESGHSGYRSGTGGKA